MRATAIYVLLVGLQICFLPLQGAAYVPLEISPDLTIGGGYDDNISLTAGKGDGGFVGRVAPRLALVLPLRRMDMTIDQSYYYYYNGGHKDAKAYQILGKANMYIIKDLLFSISDKYLLIPVEVGRPEYSPVNLTKANELDLGAQFDYHLTPRTTSQWKYDFIRADFYDVFRSTYLSHRGMLQVKQDIMDELSFYCEYTFLTQEYTLGGSSHLIIHQGAAGLNFLFHDLIADAVFGLQSIDTGEGGWRTGRLYKISLKYPATERLEARANYTQSVGEEVRLKTYDSKTADAGMSLSLGPRLQVSALGKWGDYSFYNFPLSRRFWGTQIGWSYEVIPNSQLAFTYDHYEGKDDKGVIIDNRYFLELKWILQ